jgi:hypothetical protein
MLLACCGLAAGGVASAADPAAERQRLAVERQAVEARYVAEEGECRQRFFVTPCVDEAWARRRAAMAGLREQELQLDDVERRARASERRQAIEAKSAEAAARQPAMPIPPSPPSQPASRPPAAAPSAAASAGSAAEPALRKGPDPQAAIDAAHRAAAAEKRRLEAEADRARIAAREAERLARGKASAPLPVPAEMGGSAAGR